MSRPSRESPMRLLFLLFTLFVFASASSLSVRDRYPPSRHGHTVYFELDLTWGVINANGHERHGILMNGQFPGPLLELNEGDTVEILVRNHLPFDESIHFHGIDQINTPYSDGVPGLSQRPIKSGSSFLYKWTALQYGTYWYHSHDRSHIMDGLYGPINIKPGKHNPSPFHLISKNRKDILEMVEAELHPKPVLLSDWSHIPSHKFFQLEKEADFDNFCTDSVLINGKGKEICLSQEEINSLANPAVLQILGGKYNLTKKGCIPPEGVPNPFKHDYSKIPPDAVSTCSPSKGFREIINVDACRGWVSINLINSASINTFTFSIDEHPMYIYAVDGRHVEPVKVDAISVDQGNRYSAMVKLDRKPGDYPIRVANPGINQLYSGFATLSYKGGKPGLKTKPYINYAGVNTTSSVVFFDPSTIRPFPPIVPAATADATHHLAISNFEKAWKWTLSGKQSYSLDLEKVTPFLFDPKSAYATNPNLTIATKLNDWVDLVVEVLPPIAPPHPLHKHGNKGWIIGQGTGAFNWSTTAEAIKAVPQFFNLKNPPYRDGFTTLPVVGQATWIVIRYQASDPGAWLFHCHIQTHLAGGMAVAILDGVDHFPKVPDAYLHHNGFPKGHHGGGGGYGGSYGHH